MNDPNSDTSGGRTGPGDAGPYLLVGCVAVALEALVLVVLGVAELLSVEGDRIGLGVSTGVFFLVLGGGLGWCVRGLWQRVSWVGGPVVLAQLIALGLAWNFRTVSPKVIAVGLLIVAVVALVALLSPAATAALNAEDRRLDSDE